MLFTPNYQWIYTKMNAIPEFVAGPTDGGTLQPNIKPEPTTGDHSELYFCSDFEDYINLLNLDRNKPFSV
jgi:hypothetical protein